MLKIISTLILYNIEYSDFVANAKGSYVRITVTGLPFGAWSSYYEFSVF